MRPQQQFYNQNYQHAKPIDKRNGAEKAGDAMIDFAKNTPSRIARTNKKIDKLYDLKEAILKGYLKL